MEQIIRSDIAGRPDIELLVHRFYDKVRTDDLLEPIFNDVANVDWSEHLPRLCDFWQTVLFGDGRFCGDRYGGMP